MVILVQFFVTSCVLIIDKIIRAKNLLHSVQGDSCLPFLDLEYEHDHRNRFFPRISEMYC